MKVRSMCGMAISVMGLALSASAQEKIEYEVHDGRRPQPTVITPGTFSTQNQPGKPPSDAIVLFDGKDLSRWESVKGGDAPWKVVDGDIQCVPGSGNIQTKQQFADVQLHVEVLEPEGTEGRSQERGNSGVFLQSYRLRNGWCRKGPPAQLAWPLLCVWRHECWVTAL